MNREEAWRRYHRLRIERAREIFARRGFKTHSFESAEESAEFFFSEVGPDDVVGYGGSDTIREIGVFDRLRSGEYRFLDRSTRGSTYDEQLEVRRQTLCADVLIASSNAASIDGALVNVDGEGNRVAALSFGPRCVYLFIGRNKLCDDLESAMKRARNVACVGLAIRLERQTPCAKTGMCADCSSPDRICSYMSIIEHCEPPGRINLLFVNEDLGL